jgi:DNA-binding transcriptional MerR regulator
MTIKRFTATTLARMADCHRNTVSNYTKAGVLTPITLSDGTRAYGLEDLARLREIAPRMGRRKRTPASEGGPLI